MSGFLRWYQSVLNRRPLLTQMISSGLISSSGDLISQFVLERRSWQQYDGWRTAKFFCLAGCFVAPCLNRWFHVIEKLKGGNAKWLPLKRLFIDQICFSPFFFVYVLMTLRTLEGRDLQKSIELLKRDWPVIYFNSLKVWPAVQLFNFLFVPLNLRVILVQFVTLFWNSFFSYKTQEKIKIVEYEEKNN